jgi:hypothetical protein
MGVRGSIELAHDAFELRHQGVAATGIAVLVDAARPLLLFELHELAEELFLALQQLLGLAGAGRSTAHAGPQAGDENHQAGADADVAQRAIVKRQAAQVDGQRVAGIQPSAGGHEERRAAARL